MGLQPAMIFTGHDHFGCAYDHSPRTHERTVAAVQGGFGGNVGVLSARRSDDVADAVELVFTAVPFMRTTTLMVGLLASAAWPACAAFGWWWRGRRPTTAGNAPPTKKRTKIA